jgi:hypothetical protein
MDPDLDLYDRIADLEVAVDGYGLRRHERETTSDFTRVTTEISLRGDGRVGRGEDVTYDAADHDALHAATEPFGDLAGRYTLREFAAALDGRDLFPDPPGREDFRHYRRWALESAALDLALRQADTDLGSALDRRYDPVRFVVSTRLGDPPTPARVRRWLDRNPDLEFKLDPTPEWTPDLADALAETGAVRILDLKSGYGADSGVGVEPDADLYRLVVESFPGAVIEDPGLTDDTRPILADADAEERVSWDVPITSVGSVRELPWEPAYLNVKPSRFGTLESLFETLSYCLHPERAITLYSGGQFELGIGRGQIQELASLCYPDGPNDCAPRGYNDPEPGADLPSSPLAPAPTVGFGPEPH